MLDVHLARQLGSFCLRTDFDIGPEVLVLFGASGAGKTMTLNAIAGLVDPDSGRISLNDRVLYDSEQKINLPPRARRIGFVFQDYALFPHLRVRDNVAFGLRAQSDARARVDEMLSLTHLADYADRYPAQLSGGQRQRVALARALATRPELLLLDEPFSALDAPTRMKLRHELRELQGEFKIPVVFVTHDLGEAYFMADQLAVVDSGRIRQIGSPGEILRHPLDLQVARAVGVKNILPGVIAGHDSRGSRVRVGQMTLDAPSCSFPVGTPLYVCLRPERIMLLLDERAGGPGRENALQGHLTREVSDGMNVTLFFRADHDRMMPEQDYDVQIELPVYVYERLDLAHRREWTVSLRKNAMHLIQ